MFKFTPAKYQSSFVFVAAVVMSILCSNLLGVYGGTDNKDVLGTTPQVPPHGPPYCGMAEAVCLGPYEPICGSDGITYGNLCHLNNIANKCLRLNVTMVHNGTCPQQHCVPQPKNPLVCRYCPCSLRCSNILKPVCGTDGITYRNACKLAIYSVCGYYPARVCHKGPCKPGNFIVGDTLAKE